MSSHEPLVDAVRRVLEHLRTRSGLGVERLRGTEVDLGPLAELAPVRNTMAQNDIDAATAIVSVVRACARRLEPADLVVADAALALHLFDDKRPRSVDLQQLYATDLGARRAYVVERWHALHGALGTETVPPAPTVRSLRSSIESVAFSALADAIAAGMPLEEGGIVVVGDAVNDLLFRVGQLPTTAAPAVGRYFVNLGGKGLNQAVAVAKFGAPVHLLTAVGDDDAGLRIVQYLADSNVGTDLVKLVAGAPTPVTALTIAANGETLAVACKDDRIRLDYSDVRNPAVRAAIESADVLILTFEHPPEVIRWVLGVVAELGTARPTVLLHPSPPSTPPDFYDFGLVDYLIGTPAQLTALTPYGGAPGIDTLAAQLLTLGVGTVCVTEDFQSHVRSAELTYDSARFAAALTDTPGARDAFVAALAYRLFDSSDGPTETDFDWATAAMAAAQSIGGVPSAMPAAEKVDRVLRIERIQ